MVDTNLAAFDTLCRAMALLALVCTVGCKSDESSSRADTVFTNSVFGDLQAKQPQNHPDGTSTARLPRYGVIQSFPAGPGLLPVGSSDNTSAGQYTLNFVNTDVKDVARAILSEALHLNYTITGDLSGPVTISSARPVSRDQLLSTLETSLGSFGFSLVKSGGDYRIISTTNASGGNIDFGTRTRAGYGVSIIPLNFTSATAMTSLLSGFVTQAEGLRIDTVGRSIIVRGSGPQRSEVVDAVLNFDSDFMQNQSVSIFQLASARPEEVVPELERIFGTSGDAGAIQFRKVSRLRGVMAISRNPTLIKRAETWVRRLDQDTESGRNIIVYKAKYRKAAELAAVMTNLFGGGASSTGAAHQSFSSARTTDANLNDNQGSGARSKAESYAEERISSAFTAPDSQLLTASSNIPNVIDLTDSTVPTQNPIRISADASNNSVVIYGDPERADEIVRTLRRLDATPTQVAINVTIAEVRLTGDLKYGVEYFIKSKNLGLGDNRGSISLMDQASGVLKRQIPGLNFLLGSNSDPDVIISALDVISDVEVLSSPSLVVLENQKATLQVGDEVPITTRQAQSIESNTAPVVNQVEFKNTGIILNVTPRIGQNDAVTMQIEQEISNVSAGANTLTPTISKRRVESQISVNNQQTVLLGGLISAGSSNKKSGVPGVSKVPVLGDLFGATGKSNNRTELIILIRPVVIRDPQDAANVAESLRAQMSVIGKRGGGTLK